jgi:phosphomevalonate kinase
MQSITTSAPGKLVLLGEYAVLFGAPAAVAAIDRRASVRLTARAGEDWRVMAPDLVENPARFGPGAANSVRWIENQGYGAFELLEKLFEGLQGSIDLQNLPSLSMTLDTRAFFESTERERTKLGLGSSAALTVALACGLEGWADGELDGEPAARLRRYVDLHRAVQGGEGSGIDVAASTLGGVVRYRLGDDGSIAEAEPLVLPGKLGLVFVWTGRSASTGDFLGRLHARRTESPGEVDPVLDELGTVSASGVEALGGDDAEAFLDAVDAFWSVLDRLGDAIDMPILSDDHRRLRQIATECGVHYKPSGAGGGDFGIAFAAEIAEVDAFGSRAEAAGYRVVDLSLDHLGLTSSST